jgi:ribonucleoside-diphosphate reductase alpha chain
MQAVSEEKKAPKKSSSPAKIRFQRYFTTEGTHPFQTVEWTTRDAVLVGANGKEKFRQNGIEVPKYWNEVTTNIVAEKYFRVVKGEKEKSAKQMFHRVAYWMTKQAVAQGLLDGELVSNEQLNGSWLVAGEPGIYYDELLYMLLHGMFAFNSPVWFNVGVAEKPQCSACFIQSVRDEMDDIMNLAKKEVMLFKGGSGTGSNLSPLRSSYEGLSNGGIASGPVSFMKGYDSFAGATKSGGGTRRAAKMVVLNHDHPDILEQKNGEPGFVTCKSDAEQVAHDLYSTGKYSAEFNAPGNVYERVGFQNANNSVRVTDEFMKAVEKDGDFWTKAVKDGKPIKKYKARHLWKEIAKAAWMCGDPGLQFDTATNDWHTSPNSGRINASNPCSEYLYLDDTACNLASLNLRKFVKEDWSFDVDGFEHACAIAITGMEAAVEGSSYPSPVIERNSHTYRTLGLGYTNLGDLLTVWGMPYDSNDGRSVAAGITAIMGGAAQRQSALLAEVKGPFEAFEINREAMLAVVKKHTNAAKRIPVPMDKRFHALIERAPEVWGEALSLGKKFGYRNGQVTVLAPTGTISFLMSARTTGIEPDLYIITYKKLVGGGSAKMANESVPVALKNLGYSELEIEAILEYIKEKEVIVGAPGFDNERHAAVFPSAIGDNALRAEAHILMMAAVQPFLSGGISKTVNLPNNATVEDFEAAYMLAWKSGLKCVAIYRDNCKLSQPVSTSNKTLDGQIIKSLAWGERKKMPDERAAKTAKANIGGTELYITPGFFEDGTLGEVFIRVSKQGSTMNGIVDAFATAVSIGLQHGVPLETFIEKFSDQEFEPKGWTSHPIIRRARSIPDFMAQWLALNYAPEAKHLLRLREASIETPEVRTLPEYRGPDRRNADGPPCTRCGNMTKRAGTCYVCNSCGETTGCG